MIGKASASLASEAFSVYYILLNVVLLTLPNRTLQVISNTEPIFSYRFDLVHLAKPDRSDRAIYLPLLSRGQ